jgi:SEC-C motif domain protein
MPIPEVGSKSGDKETRCPCGSGLPFESCCGPVLAGNRLAETAEALMRARFTAHVRHEFAFLHRSHRPTARLPYVPEPGEGKRVQWTRLVIHGHSLGKSPDTAYVDFSAYGTEDGAEVVLHENAEFLRENGAWTYARALREGPAPYRREAPRPGRNDPCPCGSGKKYKQCCLGKG